MLSVTLALFAVAGSVRSVAEAGMERPIPNIGIFLDQCPDRDPAFSTIMHDFEIRRDRVLVSTPACTEPVSAMPTAQYTDELIVLQGLRVIYYMDRGQAGHLPWTDGTLYDWMKRKIGGINIMSGGSFCCTNIGNRVFINIGSEDDFNRDFDRRWRGIAGNIDLYAHETRHVDGFPHTSCCGIPGGCDNTFDVANLSPYGVQWWLNKLWLEGTINVGYECLSASEVIATTAWFLGAVNDQFRSRFCTNQPSIVSPPAVAGGPCQLRRRAARH